MTANLMRFECFWFHQKIFIFRKVTADLLPSVSFRTRIFSKYIFKKLFKKSKIAIFQKITFSIFLWKVNENRKFQNFEKPKILIFWKVFWKVLFLKIELSFFDHKKFSAVTFRKYIFFKSKSIWSVLSVAFIFAIGHQKRTTT